MTGFIGVDYEGTGAATGGDTVWAVWCNASNNTTCDATTTTLDLTWNNWVGAAATGAVTNTAFTSDNSTASTWRLWVGGTGGRIRVASSGGASGGNFAREETPEERAERERRAEEYRKQEEKKQKERAAAEAKAEDLFRELVGKKAYQRFKEKGYYDAVGESGTRYRLRIHAKIKVMKSPFGREVDHELCIHPPGYAPAFDTLVTQLLLIRAGKEGEEILRKTANRHEVYQAVDEAA